jgi:hypothetical protein
MSTYCSIQEAWNQPSFSKPRKTSSSMMQCGNTGSPTPNNLYTNQSGNEQAVYAPSPQMQQAPKSRTPNTRQVSTPKMVESFMCSGPAAAVPTGSSGMMSQKHDPATGNISYASQANDFKYYCDNMGICPTPQMSIEGFTNNPQQGCQLPEQSTAYTYPISDLTKQQQEAAMNVYINNGQQANTPQTQKRNTNMDNVTGLYDDEISQYMRVQDMGLPYQNSTTAIYDNANFPSHQFPKPPQTSTPQPSDDNHSLSSPSDFKPATNTALTQAQGKFSTITTGPNTIIQTEQTVQTPQKEATSKWQYIMDTVLFIAAGVLIIILCDLLFKIAYSVGMRDTFTLLQPYLTEIDELKAKIAELVPEEID